jgi:hypothetical protein
VAGVTVAVLGGNEWRRMVAGAGEAAGKVHLEIGLLAGTGGGYSEYGGLSAATIGFWHEFGTSRTPPRPFLRLAADRHGQAWVGAASAMVKANSARFVQDPTGTLRTCLDAAGQMAESDVKRIFSSGQIAPPVGEAREAYKAKVKPESVGAPLVFSGQLSQAISHEVKTS